jgi:hypothetical protein
MRRIIYITIIFSLLFINACKDDDKVVERNLDTHADWMTSLINTKGEAVTLRNISVPRAHDAGMYELTSCSLGANACNTKTQDINMTAMLSAGVRMYDIRPTLSDGTYYTEHSTECGGLGCKGDLISNILQQTKDFLDTHSELVVFTFGHWCNTGVEDEDLLTMVESVMGDRLHKDGNSSGNFIDTPIGNILDVNGAKGKLIIMYSGATETPENRAKGMFTYSYIPTEGSYANSYNFNEMSSDQIQKFNDFDPNNNAIFRTSWTMTLDAGLSIACVFSPNESIEFYANQANDALPSSIDELIANETIRKGKIFNIISVDFADTFVTDECIKLSALNLE